jgi:hypothetical protein
MSRSAMPRRTSSGFSGSLMRVGEDLYPKTFFRAIALPQSVKKAVLAAA